VVSEEVTFTQVVESSDREALELYGRLQSEGAYVGKLLHDNDLLMVLARRVIGIQCRSPIGSIIP